MATYFILKSYGIVKPNIAAFPMLCNKHGNSKSVFKCKKIFNYILTYHNPLGNYAYNQGMQKNAIIEIPSAFIEMHRNA